jgi:hypothetical protein
MRCSQAQEKIKNYFFWARFARDEYVAEMAAAG